MKNVLPLFAASLCLVALSQPALAQDSEPASPAPQVIKRGQDYSVYARITPYLDEEGNTQYATNHTFNLVENGLNYFEDGEWKLSEDLIEPFADGAVARRGPHKAIFSHDLNTEAVFDLLSSDGDRLRGGVRAIQITDLASGLSQVIATVKASVPGELIPPNTIVYRDAFDGLAADVVLVWKHNYFAQDVVLNERFALPEGFDPDSTQIEVLTGFITPPEPELRNTTLRRGEGQIEDAGLALFGRFTMLPGKAFPIQPGDALSLGAGSSREEGAHVAKEWHALPDQRHFLIESVSWNDALPHLQKLALNTINSATKNVASARTWPKPVSNSSEPEPILLASSDYQPNGYIIDFEIVPDSAPTTFLTGETYILRTHYYTTSATFQPGCVIKMWGNNGAKLTLYGYFSFPDTLQSPVFTSIDDDSFGERFPGTSNPFTPASDGNPADNLANDLIRVWYINYSSLIRSSVFRWAENGIEYWQTGSSANHTIQNCRFEHFQQSGLANAIAGSIDPARTLSFVNSEKFLVDTDGSLTSGTVAGSLAASPFGTQKGFPGLGKRKLFDSPDLALAVAPDTLGAIGPNHFVEPLNRVIGVFSRSTGELLDWKLAKNLFGAGEGDWLDPRVLYDPQAQRWVICMLNTLPVGSLKREVRVAITKTDGQKNDSKDPLPLTTDQWHVTTILGEFPDWKADFPTLGFDKNGIYIVTHLYQPDLSSPTNSAQAIIGLRKHNTTGALVWQNGPEIQFAGTIQGSYHWRVWQPAFNYDTGISATDYAWLIAKDDPTTNRQGAFAYQKLQWQNVGGSYSLTMVSGGTIIQPANTYYDLDNETTSGAKEAPQKPYDASNNVPIQLHIQGSRLSTAMAQKINGNTYIWSSHNVGLNSSGTASTPTRTGVQWLKFQVGSGGTLSLVDSGRIYDPATTGPPYFYYRPSLAVNSLGDFVLGFSGSKNTEHIGAFYTGRTASGSMPLRLHLFEAGRGYFKENDWGHYSHTTLDPMDATGRSFWTIQQYAERAESGYSQTNGFWYGTWIAEIKTQ